MEKKKKKTLKMKKICLNNTARDNIAKLNVHENHQNIMSRQKIVVGKKNGKIV